jgi:hypothetical protein
MEAYKKVMWGSTVVVALLTGFLLVYFFFLKPGMESGSKQASTPGIKDTTGPGDKIQTTPGNTTAPGPSAAQAEEETSPAETALRLNSSDEPLRELLKDSSTHPEYHRWLKSKNIIRRFVAVVDNISNGRSPGAHLDFLMKPGIFEVIRKDGKITLDPRSYIRYQPVTMALVSVDSGRLKATFRKLLPLMEEAYGELGYPDRQFKQVLAEALNLLLKTPVVDGDIQLEEKVTTYAFADPRLEALPDAQKHLLRMGPENTRKIKRKIRELMAALKREGLL